MKLLGRYIVRQALRPFLIIIALALFLLLLERMLRLLDQVLGFGGSPLLLMEMLAFLVPHYMALALPAGFFLGVLLAFSGMHQRSELDALGSAGVSLYGIIRPVFVLGIILSILAAVNASYAQPYARYIYRSLVHFVAETSILGYLQERTAVEVGDYTFLADHERLGGRNFGKIFIYEKLETGGSITTTAEQARLLTALEDSRLVLSLSNGVRMIMRSDQVVDPEGSNQVDAPPEEMVFDRVDVPIRLDGRSVFRDRGNDERELTFLELWQQRGAPPRGASSGEMLAELNDHLVRAVSIIFLPLLAVGFAVGPRRSAGAYRIGLGILVVIIYNEMLSVGKFSTADERLSPFIGQWLPFVVFAIGSMYVFHRASDRLPTTRALPDWLVWIERIDFARLRQYLPGQRS